MTTVHLDHAALQQTYQREQYMQCNLIPTPTPIFLQYIEKILIGTEKDTKCF